jgi:GNAT superfamily N-acetyltransferase
VVAADVDQAFVDARLPRWELSGAFTPPFLGDLATTLGRRVNAVDMLVLADPLAGAAPLPLTPVEDQDHPRVRRARRYRDDVRVWAFDGGVLIVGTGLAGRVEVALEVDEDARGKGLGRAAARAARHLVDRPLWAQVTPGNAASVRAFLAAGYRPVAQEALLVR